MTQPERRGLRPMIGLFALVAVAVAAGLLLISRGDQDPLEERLRALQSGETAARRTAAEELGTAGEGGHAQVVAGLTAALDDEDPGVRARAAHSLGRHLVLHPDVAGTGRARAAL